MKLPAPLPEPSPKMVSMTIPLSLYIIAPASAITLSPGSSSISTYCISAPKILKSISSALAAPTGGGGAVLPPPVTEVSSSISEMGTQAVNPSLQA